MLASNLIMLLEFSLVLPLMAIGLLLSAIWNVYFVKKIWDSIRFYRVCLEEAKYDPFGNVSAIACHYRTEAIKYTFLLLINISEFCSMSIYALGSALTEVPSSYDRLYKRDTIPNCTVELIHSQTFGLRLIYGNPISILVSIGQAGLMLSLGFGICLMKYLHDIYHSISSPFHPIRHLLIVSVLVAVPLVVTGAVPQLIIIHELVEPIVQFIYLCVWIKHTRMFYRTLKWRSFEFRVRGNNALVRRSVISCYQFKIVMVCVGIVYVCLIFGEFLAEYFSLFAIAVHYGPCLFNYLYGTAYYEPLLQIDALGLSFRIESTTTIPLVFTALFFGGLQYILSTVLFFGGILIQRLKYRYRRVRTRFTPSLTRHLLSV